MRGDQVVTPDGIRPAAISISDGIIVAVTAIDERPGGRVVDAGRLVVAPGLVDIHVHVNEPGRTEWEGIATATRAAAAGGVTTLIDMPLNSVPPTVTATALHAKRAAAEGQCHTDVGFWGGIVPDTDDLEALHAAGVFGFKAFLVDSGVDEFGAVTAPQLEDAMRRLEALDALTLVHAEDADVIAAAAGAFDRADPRAYRTYLASRPDEAERRAVERVAQLAEATGARAHVLHLSSAEALAPLRAAVGRDVQITAETCPHYLTLTAEEVPDGATAFKCAPPIRSAANSEQLWTALTDGTLRLVASDHCPCPADLKYPEKGDFARAWGGIGSLELGLAVVWTRARERGASPVDLTRWMSTAPAELVGLSRKGAIVAGNDADLVIWDPDASEVIDGAKLQQRHPVTPYDGMRVQGRVTATYLRGELVYEDGKIVGPPLGRLLARESA